jgi:glycosyltransferase involved in cell wall biosynthesis
VRPRLTIITPSYNQAAFIERTLESVFAQGYENLEYLVVDGGSTDGSVDVIRRYEDRLAWWVSEKDHGQTDALNKALRRATGDIVAYINSDDYYLPGAFDAAVGALESSDAAWAVGASRFVDADDNVTEVWRPELPKLPRHWWMLLPWGVPQPSSFWRRRVFDELGPFREDMHYVFDTEHGLRLAYAGLWPALIDRELAVRVVHPEAKSWNPEEFARERRRFIALYKPALTRYERARLALTRALKAVGFYRLTSAVHPVTGPVRRRLERRWARLPWASG